MYLSVLTVFLALAFALIAVGAYSRDTRFLYPAGALFIIIGMLLLTSGIQVPTGEQTTVPSPSVRESSAASAGSVDPFGVQVSKEYSTVFSLESTKPISLLRDRVQKRGAGGSVTKLDAEYAVNSSPGGEVLLDSAEQSTYISGKVALWGIGIREPVNFNASAQSWKAGQFSDTNGFYIGRDSNGTYVATRSAGTQLAKVYREEWNGNTRQINWSNGVIVQGRWIYYGYGGPVDAAIYILEDTTDSGITKWYSDAMHRLHTFSFTGETTFNSTRMPVRAVGTDSDAENGPELFVAGRHSSILGEYSPLVRVSTEETDITSSNPDDWVQVATWRHAPGREELRAYIDGFTSVVSCTSEWQWRIHRPENTTGATWQNPAMIGDEETVMQVSENATVPDTSGVLVDSGYMSGERNDVNIDRTQVNTVLPAHLHATLFMKRYEGTQDCAISAKSRVTEQW